MNFRRLLINLAAALSGFCLLLPGLAQAYPFDHAQDYAVGDQPQGIAVADFNGDGHLDWAVADRGADRVSVLLGNGSGGFSAAVDYAVGRNPVEIAAADFNGDSHTDLVVTDSGSDQFSYLQNRGDGTFAASVETATGSYPQGIAVGDLNGDDQEDVVVANMSDGTVSIYLGNGDGTFTKTRTDESTLGQYPSEVKIADFDGDRINDVAVANSCAGCFLAYNTGSVTIMTGVGDGTFNAGVKFPATKGVVGMDVQDFNGDGNEDVVVAQRALGQAGIFLGNGDGTLQAIADYGTGSLPSSLVAGDYDSDSKMDMVVTNAADDTLSFLMGNGDGTFAAQTTTSTGSGPMYIAQGDFNEDGKVDLAVSNNSDDTVRVYLDTSPPTITALVPDAIQAGTNGHYLTVEGGGFGPGSLITIDGNRYGTTYLDHSHLRTLLSQNDLAAAGTKTVKVRDDSTGTLSSPSDLSITSASSNGGGGGIAPEAFVRPAEPEGGFRIIVNDGDGVTDSGLVSLKFMTHGLNGPEANRFAVSNDSTFDGASILGLAAYADKGYDWRICSADCHAGTYTVYAKFYTAWGQVSPVVSADVVFRKGTIKQAVVSSEPILAVNAWNRTLRLGSEGNDVLALQRFLNTHGFVVAASGAGSPGHETTRFGLLTQKALKAFQERYADGILHPLGLASGTGILGSSTIGFIEQGNF